VGDPEQVPNMFPALQPAREPNRRPFHTDADETAEGAGNNQGTASVVDVREEQEDERKPERSRGFLGLFRSRSEDQ
jgi:hypothetical protein